jgi:hypothetical protein
VPTEAISEKSYWTKSLRDSLELTELVMLRGMRWCAAVWSLHASRPAAPISS